MKMKTSEIPSSVVVSIMATMLSSLCVAQVLPDSIVVWGPMLGMTDAQAFVAIDTDRPVRALIEINGQTIDSTDSEFEYHKQIALPAGLRGAFAYRVSLVASDKRELVLGPYDARLPGEPGRSLRFVVYGDTRGEDSVHYRIVRQILDSDPDFVLNTGDLVDNGNKWNEWLEFRRTTGDLLARRLYIPCLGNHDRRSPTYFEIFRLPGNEAWFEWNWEHIRLIVLDSTLPANQQSEQTHWLDSVLSVPESPGNVTIAMFHHPPIGSGRHLPWAYGLEHWVPLITSSPVDMIFLGHNHRYERLEYRGKPYIVTGGGGAALDQSSRDAPESVLSVIDHHFVEVRYDSARLSGIVLDAEGDTIDTWEYRIILPPYQSRGE